MIGVCMFCIIFFHYSQEERSRVDDLRGTPMSVGNLEEIIDDNHAIVSTSVGSEHYVSVLSFVDKDQLEPGCSVLLNHKVILSPPLSHFLTSFLLLGARCGGSVG
jgi:ATP-dependent 26S proteasome regulatory subunit